MATSADREVRTQVEIVMGSFAVTGTDVADADELGEVS